MNHESHSDSTARIAIGHYVVEIGDPGGAVIRTRAPDRAPYRRRLTPVLSRPRSLRGMVGRGDEIATVVSALEAGLPVEVTGPAGIGKTAILRQLAHHPYTTAFADGIVYASARHQSREDLLQIVYEAFCGRELIGKPTDTELGAELRGKQALVLLDDVGLAPQDVEHVIDAAPRSLFVIATRERCLWSDVRCLALGGLPVDDATVLLERTLERSLEDPERALARELCARFEGHPLRIQQAAALARERGFSSDGWADLRHAGSLVTALLKPIDDRQRRALLALTALPRVPLRVQMISEIADVPNLAPALAALVRGGLVEAHPDERYQLSPGVADRLRRTEDLHPWAHRAITYCTAWAERQRRRPDVVLADVEALLCVQQRAVDARRWGEVLRLGACLDSPLAIGARWGAWVIALGHSLTAARSLSDRAAEAFVLHQLGTRAVCADEPVAARQWLGQAVTIRDSMQDAGADASRHNLSFVQAPEPSPSHDSLALLSDDVLDRNALPLGPVTTSRARPQPAWGRVSWPVAILLLATCAVVSFLASDMALAGQPSRVAIRWWSDFTTTATTTTTAPNLKPQPLERAPIVTSTEMALSAGGPVSSVVTGPSSIRIFTARPGSIASTMSTELCYAVDGAYQARIEPGIGDVDPSSTLSCRQVRPRRTTTYELTAFGRDGNRVSRQLVIVVHR